MNDDELADFINDQLDDFREEADGMLVKPEEVSEAQWDRVYLPIALDRGVHILEGGKCWCSPRRVYSGEEAGQWVHNDIQ